jgi:transcription factor E2F3
MIKMSSNSLPERRWLLLQMDTDYWFLSDASVGITDIWKNDPSNAMWDEMVRLNAEFGIGEIGSPHPHTPPSGNTLEVEPVS